MERGEATSNGPHISTTHLGAALWLLRLEGEHDVSTVARLREAIEGVFAQGTCVVLDLSQATFVDSSVLGELIRAHNRVAATRDEKLAVVAPASSAAARLFDLTGVDDTWFPRFESRTDALAWSEGAVSGHA